MERLLPLVQRWTRVSGHSPVWETDSQQRSAYVELDRIRGEQGGCPESGPRLLSVPSNYHIQWPLKAQPLSFCSLHNSSWPAPVSQALLWALWIAVTKSPCPHGSIPAIEFATRGRVLPSFFNQGDHWVWKPSFPLCPTPITGNYDPRHDS